jgi:hypothetical protein
MSWENLVHSAAQCSATSWNNEIEIRDDFQRHEKFNVPGELGTFTISAAE